MKSKFKSSFFCTLLLLSVCSFGANSKISYSVINLGTNRWQYNYDVINIDLENPIHDFTIWFDYDLFENLTIVTQDPLASQWTESIWQPDALFGPGGYDAKIQNNGIVKGNNTEGFSVEFDWLGAGTPGSQYYEIINPTDYSTIESGYTVPEPLTISYIVLGGLALLNKRK